MRILSLLLSLPFLLFVNKSMSQGCSDAGVCTMGAIHAYSNDSSEVKTEATSILTYKISQSVGLGEQSTIHLLSVAELNAVVNPNIFLQVKIPYLINIGNLANTQGVGDISLSATISKRVRTNSTFNTIFGFKIPLNNSNLSIDSKALPMPYQTSLGTFDAILGFVYQYKQWSFTTAYQKVLSSNNENAFNPNPLIWNNTDALKYFNSNKFDRGDDAILKVERTFNYRNNWAFSPSVLAITRVQKDKIVDVSTNTETELSGSSGLTLNLIGNASYQFQNRRGIDFTLAFPVIVRQVRADGLTRSMIANLSYRF